MELWELVIPICDWFILIWSQGLFPRTIHTKRFEEQVARTCPKNSNIRGTSRWDQILVPATRFSGKNG